jgi:hypothetical protein
MNTVNTAILALAIVVGGFLVGGRYDSHATDRRAIVLMDRLLGTAYLCDPSPGRPRCYSVEVEDRIPPVPQIPK